MFYTGRAETIMGRANDQGWCILRTSAARTLKLADRLREAGYQVWTPVAMVERRHGRARQRVEYPAPITPTFVFAQAAQLADLIRAERAPFSALPPFSILRRSDRTIPKIADRSLEALRREEQRCHLRQRKAKRFEVAAGTKIKLSEGPFAGMTGIVERGNGKEAVVNFGSGFVVSIATYLLETDVLRNDNIAA